MKRTPSNEVTSGDGAGPLQFAFVARRCATTGFFIRGMRAISHIIVIGLITGCTTGRERVPYSYSAPVVISLKTMASARDDWAYFTLTNVSQVPMWLFANGELVKCYLQQKSFSMYDPRPIFNEDDCGWPGWDMRKLGVGECTTFKIPFRGAPQEAFRVGVWLSPEPDNKSRCDLVYWSDYMNP